MKFAVALTVLASLVAAAPTEKRAEGGPYNVEITYTRPQNVTEHSLANARLRTMFKYSHGLKPEERAALETEIHEHAKRFNIPITSIVDRSYSASIGFGTPSQKLDLIIDTGSPTLFTFAPDCTGTCGVAPFHEEQSSTYQSTYVPTSLGYGVGQADGTLVKDIVNFGGLATSSEFVLANSARDFNELVRSGILGLSWPSGTYNPIWLQQIQQGAWGSNKQFGVYLNRAPPYVNSAPGGVLTLGGVDNTKFTGSLDYVPIRTNNPENLKFSWTVPGQKIDINGRSINLNGAGLIMDTGTSLIMGPPQAVREFYSSIPGAYELSGPSAGQFSVPCNTANLGLAFTINGHKYSVRDSDFVINAGYFCIGGVALLNSWPFGDDWLLGDVFLKNVYSAYRHSPVPAVGLAPSI